MLGVQVFVQVLVHTHPLHILFHCRDREQLLFDHLADASEWRMLESADDIRQKVNMQSSSALRFHRTSHAVAASKQAAKGIHIAAELVLTQIAGSWLVKGPIMKTTEDGPVPEKERPHN